MHNDGFEETRSRLQHLKHDRLNGTGALLGVQGRRKLVLLVVRWNEVALLKPDWLTTRSKTDLLLALGVYEGGSAW